MTKKKALLAVATATLAVIVIGVMLIGVNAAVNSPQRLLSLGEKYLLEMDYEQAVVYFERVIKIDPKNARAYIGAAEAYAALGDTEKAVEILRQGLAQTEDAAIAAYLATLETPTTAQAKETVADAQVASSIDMPQSAENPTVTPSIPTLDSECELVAVADMDRASLVELFLQANPFADTISYDDNIDNIMLWACLPMIEPERSFPEEETPDNLGFTPAGALQRVSLNAMQSKAMGIYSRGLATPEKLERYHDGYFYFDHFDSEGYFFAYNEYTIENVYDLSNGFFKVTGEAIDYHYATGDFEQSKRYTAMVKKEMTAEYGYYLLCQDFEESYGLEPVIETEITENYQSGNTAGNIYYSGNFAEDEEWIYFTDWQTTGPLYKLNYAARLSKIKKDGSQKMELYDGRAEQINVLDGWVFFCVPSGDFYCDIYKIKKDGTALTKLIANADSYNNYYVVGYWVYFSRYAQTKSDSGSTIMQGYICRIKTDGSEESVLLNENGRVTQMFVVRDSIFYGSSDYQVYKIDTNGSHRTLISLLSAPEFGEIGMAIIPDNDWIYYRRLIEVSMDEATYEYGRVRTDNTASEVFDVDAFGNVYRNAIYYSDMTGLYRYDLTTKVSQRISDIDCMRIWIVADTIYLQAYSGGIYRMNTDGSRLEPFGKDMYGGVPK